MNDEQHAAGNKLRGRMTLNGGVAFGSALASPVGAFMAHPVAALIASFTSNYAAHHEVVYKSPFTDEDEPEPSTK